MVLGHTSMQRDTIALSVALRAESMVAFECRPAAFFNLRDDQSVAAQGSAIALGEKRSPEVNRMVINALTCNRVQTIN
jgi:hypothetical protein